MSTHPTPQLPDDDTVKTVCRRVLNSADGQVLLALLQKRTTARPCLPASAPDGMSMSLLMAMREGENNLVRFIETLAKVSSPT